MSHPVNAESSSRVERLDGMCSVLDPSLSLKVSIVFLF